jgi:hypothetical protein
MPAMAEKIFGQLGIGLNPAQLLLEEHGNWGVFEGNTKTGTREILFPRIEVQK